MGKRQPFTTEELQLLMKVIDASPSQIYDDKRKRIVSFDWNEITEQFNKRSSGMYRSAASLKYKYHYIRRMAKESDCSVSLMRSSCRPITLKSMNLSCGYDLDVNRVTFKLEKGAQEESKGGSSSSYDSASNKNAADVSFVKKEEYVYDPGYAAEFNDLMSLDEEFIETEPLSVRPLKARNAPNVPETPLHSGEQERMPCSSENHSDESPEPTIVHIDRETWSPLSNDQSSTGVLFELERSYLKEAHELKMKLMLERHKLTIEKIEKESEYRLKNLKEQHLLQLEVLKSKIIS